MNRPKVIGVGFHKTGTTTLGTCLKALGYEHISLSREAFLLYHAGEIGALLRLMDYFDSFEDWPWPLVYREAYGRFPDAKFVLTARSSEEVWFDSLADHVARGAGEEFKYRKYIYGYETPTDDRAHHIATYRRHNEGVREFFADKPGSLLEVCWERGHGWGELCGFLGVPAPAVEFPHSNRRPAGRAAGARMPGRLASLAGRALRAAGAGR